MERRDVLGASGIALAAAVAGCATSAVDGDGELSETPAAGGPSSADTNARPTGDAGVIEVRAEGVVETAPDRATLSLGVEARGDSAATVTESLAERVEALRTAIRELGIPAENVESGRYDVRQAREGSGYEGNHMLVVTLTDVDRVGAVIDAATEAGADDVGGVRFGLQDETRADVRERALDEALANADAEAEYVAENRGVELTGTRSVSTTNADVVPVEASAAELDASDDGAAPPTELDAGPVSVSASVVVTYGFE